MAMGPPQPSDMYHYYCVEMTQQAPVQRNNWAGSHPVHYFIITSILNGKQEEEVERSGRRRNPQ